MKIHKPAPPVRRAADSVRLSTGATQGFLVKFQDAQGQEHEDYVPPAQSWSEPGSNVISITADMRHLEAIPDDLPAQTSTDTGHSEGATQASADG